MNKYFEKKKLLADGGSNTKLAKNTLKTYGLSLLPHTLNSKGVNLCRFSTKECRAMCLNSSGRAAFDSVQNARLLKTDFFVNDEKDFIEKLYGELVAINKKGKSAVRLNVVSDVNWESKFNAYGKSMADFPNIIFYGYTKDPFQVYNVHLNNTGNQHITFSYSGGNWNYCEKFLREKICNVAVVFKGTPPAEYKGFKVVDGDKSDERFEDEKGVIVGLKYKVPRGIKYESNKFVVE